MTFDTIKLDKGLYSAVKSFTQSLEEIDPSECYKGTSLEGLDAFQRQLKRFDIKVGGRNSDAIEKFFINSESAALFPEYVSRAVMQGMQEADLVSKFVATTTVIDTLDYRTLAPISESDKTYPAVGEAQEIPEAIIKTQDSLVPMKKRGRVLSASYEAIRKQRLDLFTVTLRHIGAAIAKAQLSDAVAVLKGSGDTAIEEISTATNGEITYADLVDFWNQFAPYNLTTILASPDVLSKILKLPEFRDAYTGLDFHSTGKLITPFGAELYRVDDLEAGTLIGLDKSCALERVQTGTVATEFDKLINRQLERAAITSVTGFSKIYSEASKCLKIG